MHTIPHTSPIPSMLGAWDSIARSNRRREQEEDDRTARREMLEHDIHRFIASGGSLSAPLVFFKERTNGHPPTLAVAIREGLDYDDLEERMVQLLMESDSPLAQDIKREAVRNFVKSEVE